MTFDLGPGAAGSDGDQSETHVTFGSRELDRLFLLHAAALHAGEAVARWWFTWRASAQDATNEPELDTLLRESLDGIAGALHADAVAVLLADETGELVVRAATGLQPELFREVHIAAGAGMAGRVVAERRPFVVPDLSAIEVVSETLRDSGVRSLVAVPIYGG
ncbi:MAG TPA: GAF domain-containing protein, partial [Acidimicrobiales bacterium]|nr:GAF domain-containing protein [Acidimicrobiales bacterium]